MKSEPIDIREIVCNGRFTDILEAYPVGRWEGSRDQVFVEGWMLWIYTREAYQVKSLDLVWVGD